MFLGYYDYIFFGYGVFQPRTVILFSTDVLMKPILSSISTKQNKILSSIS